MKRIPTMILAAAVGFAACQKVESGGQESKTASATFAINVPEMVQTRSIADGEKATTLFYAAYSENGKLVSSLCGSKTFSGKQTTVTLELVKELEYKVVFWAQHEKSPYLFDMEKATVTVTDKYTNWANDDYRDAFYKVETDVVVKDGVPFERTVEMRRPFAQINFGASDYQAVVDYGLEGMMSYIEVSGVPYILNVLDGTLSAETVSAKFYPAPIPSGDDEYLEVDSNDYRWVSMNYVMAPVGKDVFASDLKATFVIKEEANGTEVVKLNRQVNVKNVPYRRNYMTNIIGKLFTEEAKFTIIVKEGFEKPDLPGPNDNMIIN